jgi:arylsulfatase
MTLFRTVFAACLASLYCLGSSTPVVAEDRPNIIIILSDDMGYSDIGCYGSEIETPVLDGLAANGLRFTQFYNTARCCPTRAALLTGLYQHQAGIGHMVGEHNAGGEGGRPAPYQGDLNENCVTIAEVMRTAGYRNYCVGKWHVTPKVKPEGDSEKHNWPLQRGFDRYYGTIHGAGSFFDPNSLTRDNTLISPFSDPEYQPEDGFFYTDAISDHAARFIHDHHEHDGDKPFFMYVAYTAAHWPMHARERDIEKYQGRYDDGYLPVYEARLQKMKELGLVDPAWDPAPQTGDWSQVENKPFEARCMEVYAAMVDAMDQGIGRIVDSLKETGQFEKTLVMFLQDNGGCAENMGRRQEFVARAAQPSLPPMKETDLQYDMIPKQTRDGYPMRQGYGVMPGGADTYIGYGKDWATVSNTPFREYKHWVHEGGISTPLIAHWPAGIEAKGEFRGQPGHLIDLMATCVDLGSATYPEERKGKVVTPLVGTSLKPAFSDSELEREAIYWEHEGNRAIRVGDWKLVAKGAKGKWELYDMKSDRTEMHDLAAEQPERVKELSGQWLAWAKESGAIPWIWGLPHGPEKPKKKGKKPAKK